MSLMLARFAAPFIQFSRRTDWACLMNYSLTAIGTNFFRITADILHSYFDNVMTKFMINNRPHEKLRLIC